MPLKDTDDPKSCNPVNAEVLTHLKNWEGVAAVRSTQTRRQLLRDSARTVSVGFAELLLESASHFLVCPEAPAGSRAEVPGGPPSSQQ